jgi:predicted small lipoprotein YifL
MIDTIDYYKRRSNMKRLLITIIAIMMLLGALTSCTPKLNKMEKVLDDVNAEVEKMQQLEKDIEDGKIDESEISEIPVIGGEMEVGDVEGSKELTGDIKELLIYQDTSIDVDEADSIMYYSSATYDEVKSYYEDLLKDTGMYSMVSMNEQGAMVTGTVNKSGVSIVIESLDDSVRVTMEISTLP